MQGALLLLVAVHYQKHKEMKRDSIIRHALFVQTYSEREFACLQHGIPAREGEFGFTDIEERQRTAVIY
jgi:hypothetical protein